MVPKSFQALGKVFDKLLFTFFYYYLFVYLFFNEEVFTSYCELIPVVTVQEMVAHWS